MKREGILFYDWDARRMDIDFDTGGKYGGLKPGEKLEVLAHGKWEPTRIELAPWLADIWGQDGWYLVGFPEFFGSLTGTYVRMDA